MLVRLFKARIDGVGTLGTIEGMSAISKTAISVPLKKRLKIPGTNASDFLGPFDKPSRAETWHVPQKNKGAMYGSALTLSSGKVDGDGGPDVDPGPRPKDLVPFNWHGLPSAFYLEMQHSYNVKAFIHCTGADPVLPLVCIRKKIAYLGFGFTALHVAELEEETVNQLFKAMQDPKDSEFEKDLADLLKIQTGNADDDAAPSATKGGAGKDGKKHAASAAPKATPSAMGAKDKGAKLLEKLKALDDAQESDEGEEA